MSNVLNNQVLVLNRVWQPIDVTDVETALTDIFKESKLPLSIEYAQDEHGDYIFNTPSSIIPLKLEDWMSLPLRPFDTIIHSVKISMRVPLVVVCANYSHMPVKTMKLTLGNIYQRDKGVCQYSGKKLSKKQSSIDHVVPKDRGGKHHFENVVLADRDLNSRKGNKLNEEIGLKLLKHPKAPLPQPISFSLKNSHGIREWELFLKN